MRTTQPRFGLLALFDLDGTLADYDGALDRDMKTLLPPEYADRWRTLQEEPFMKNLIRLVRSQPGWWTRLKKLDDGFQLLTLVQQLGFVTNILTKGPYNHPNSWSEKVVWCRENVPDSEIIISENKSLVYGKLLVDDWPPYVEGWLQFRPRGLVIMPDRPWNQGFVHPQVIRYANNLAEISEKLDTLKVTSWMLREGNA